MFSTFLKGHVSAMAAGSNVEHLLPEAFMAEQGGSFTGVDQTDVGFLWPASVLSCAMLARQGGVLADAVRPGVPLPPAVTRALEQEARERRPGAGAGAAPGSLAAAIMAAAGSPAPGAAGAGGDAALPSRGAAESEAWRTGGRGAASGSGAAGGRPAEAASGTARGGSAGNG